MLLDPVFVSLLIGFPLRTGTVRLHLINEHYRPIAAHEVWLEPTNSTKPVRPFGVQWRIPSESGFYHGVTNNTGDVFLSGVPLGRPMMVVTKFGPRFDSYVGDRKPIGVSFDVMKFEGAVYAGRAARLTLVQSNTISGKVIDARGNPMPGVKVQLTDTGFGHMGGYPGTTLEIEKTDARGIYRFTKLPSCRFLLAPEAGSHMAIESRVGSAPWGLLGINDQKWSSQPVYLGKTATSYDFRIQPTGAVKVSFKGTQGELKGWTAWATRESEDLMGRDLGYDESSSSFTCYSLPGQLMIWLSHGGNERRILVGKVRVADGETQTVDISIAEILKHWSKKTRQMKV